MNIKHTLLACALMALAGCASDGKWSGNGGGSTGSASNSGSMGTSSTSSPSNASSPGSSATSGTGGMASTAGSSSSPGMQSTGSGSGVVQAIDQITRQDAMSMGLSSGAAAAAGTMGSPTDKIYRVTVRMDDGTTQTVLAESMPSYKNGERVRYANGSVTRE